jgi:predicted O-methyltransferase YrrM
LSDIYFPYRYLTYRLKARHRFGRGVHPPFAYDFIREVIFGAPHHGMDIVEEIRRTMYSDMRRIWVDDQGAGSRMALKEERSIHDLARYTAISRKYGNVLARLVRYLHPGMIIELGTGTGIASLYLHLASPETSMTTIEGCKTIAGIARENFERAGVSGIELRVGKFELLLPGLLGSADNEVLLFIDGDHREEGVLKYFSDIKDAGIQSCVLVVDDINWSPGMNRAWNTLLKHSHVSLSLETFRMGILFIGKDVQKAHFIVNY